MRTKHVAFGSCFLGLMMMLLSGCVIGPREGYYDRAHGRYYHNHAWHACAEQDQHCR